MSPCSSPTLSYGALDRRAQAVAAHLQSQARPGERVLLLLPPGLEYIAAFFGCLYANMVAVPAYPPRLNRSLPRLQAITADSRASVALTSAAILGGIERHFANARDLQALRWVTLESVEPGDAATWREPRLASDDVAFLQYTAGSTAMPKGVILSHANLLHNLRLIQGCFQHTSESRGVIWLPPYHDMGLIGGILQPLFADFPVTLMAPTTFLQAPFRWLSAISQTRATTSGGPNFAYDLCVRAISAEQRATLDLSTWRIAFNGAEPVRAETLERFAAAFAACGFRREAFYPCYGLAEATLIVAGGDAAAEPPAHAFDSADLERHQAREVAPEAAGARRLVGSGGELPQQRIVIVNPEKLQPCAPGEVGEIWVAGPSVARGYWERPEENSRTFGARLAGETGAFLRTGDLGFLRDGELFVTGRLKDLIIIRGRNHYPQDIEQTVDRCHPALRPGAGAAFAAEIDGEERLCIVQEVDRQQRRVDVEAVARAVRQAVAEQHELRVHAVLLIKPLSIPKTSSGEIQRHACRTGFMDSSLSIVGQSILDQAVAAADDAGLLDVDRQSLLALEDEDQLVVLRAYVREQVAQVLGAPAVDIDPEQPLSSLGLDSLMAVELQHRIESRLDIGIPMSRLLQGISANGCAELIQAALPGEAPALPAVPDRSPAAWEPVSAGQQALWFIHELAPATAAYHLAHAVRIRGELDIARLRLAFQRLVDRHAALRTTFGLRDGQPHQFIRDSLPVSFELHQAQEWGAAALQQRLNAAAQRPFDLEHGPLLRVEVFATGAHEHVLLLAVHHLIVDFWSLTVLVRELEQLYAQPADLDRDILAAPARSYVAHVDWQRALLDGPRGQQLWEYWQTQLAGPVAPLNLPTDRPRPPIQTTNGAAQRFDIDPELAASLRRLGAAHGATLYMTLLAAFQIVLHRYAQQDDIVVGSPTAGRSRVEFTESIGYYVNPVVLRGDLSGQPSVAALLGRVRQLVLGAFEHQDYPFAALVERLQPARDPSRSPLFDVLFVMQKARQPAQQALAALALGEHTAFSFADLALESVELDQQSAQFDLTLSMAEIGDRLKGSLVYNTDLFEAATITRLSGHFQAVLRAMVAQPGLRVQAIPLLSAAEQAQVAAWNATAAPYDLTPPLHALIAAQAARTPHAVAVTTDAGASLTFQALEQRANQLAHTLIQHGVRPEDRVGLCLERSLELVVGLLAILTAGAAFVPLDPSYPAARLAGMLADAQVALVLAASTTRAALPESTTCLLLDNMDTTAVPRSAPAVAVHPDQLAYVLFTSGSTGTPKGAMNTHRAIVNRLTWMQDAYALTPADRVLQKTPISFDVAVWEFFWPLLTGATLVLARPGGHRDSAYLRQAIQQHQISTLHAVPALLQVLASEPGLAACTTLRRLICSGEALPAAAVAAVQRRLPAAAIHNLYGPTEAAVDVTAWPCDPPSTTPVVPLGRPIANTQAYVLDRGLQPAPVGVAGELYLGGVQLARGYAGRPDLTADRFGPDHLGGGAGARLYRTGDLGRWRADGVLEYLGRTDHQIKLRGQRIELGEIEAVLGAQPGVRACAVALRADAPGGAQLVAYLALAADTPGDAATVRAWLAPQLPEYMIPGLVVVLPELPRAPNGKLDRAALPAPDLGALQRQAVRIEPRDALEHQLVALWEELLNEADLARLTEPERIAALVDFARRAQVLPAGASGEYVTSTIAVVRANINAAQTYQPQPYSGKLLLIRASQQDGGNASMGWENVASAGLATQVVEGDHYAILRSPEVKTLAQHLSTFFAD